MDFRRANGWSSSPLPHLHKLLKDGPENGKPPVCFRKRAVRLGPPGVLGGDPPEGFERLSFGWGRSKNSVLLRLVVRRRRPLLVLRHELVELFLVLGVTQAVEELLELGLLLL